MGLVRQLLRQVLATMLPQRLFITRGPTDSGSICLTFDDGPHPVHTPRVLDVLKEHAVVATFFFIGQKADRYPDLVRRAWREGHAIGCHSYYHANPRRTSAGQLIEEVRRTHQVFDELAVSSGRLFRPPLGKLTAAKLLRLWREGQTIVLWNVDPRDFARSSAAELRDFFAARPLQSGDLVLLHDDHPHVAPVLPEVIRQARSRGLNFATVAQWLQPRCDPHPQPASL